MPTEFLEWHFHVIGASFPLRWCKASFLLRCLLLPWALTPTPRSVPSSGRVFACWPRMSFSFSSRHHCLPDAVFCSVDFLPTFVRHGPRAPLILFVDLHTLSPSLLSLHCLLLSGGLPSPLCSTQEPPAAPDPSVPSVLHCTGRVSQRLLNPEAA